MICGRMDFDLRKMAMLEQDILRLSEALEIKINENEDLKTKLCEGTWEIKEKELEAQINVYRLDRERWENNYKELLIQNESIKAHLRERDVLAITLENENGELKQRFILLVINKNYFLFFFFNNLTFFIIRLKIKDL